MQMVLFEGVSEIILAQLHFLFISAYAEMVFLCLFVFEMGIRMYALGMAAYFNSAFNR